MQDGLEKELTKVDAKYNKEEQALKGTLSNDKNLTEDEKVYFFEPLEKEVSIEDMQKIVDANEKLVKELKGAKD